MAAEIGEQEEVLQKAARLFWVEASRVFRFQARGGGFGFGFGGEDYFNEFRGQTCKWSRDVPKWLSLCCALGRKPLVEVEPSPQKLRESQACVQNTAFWKPAVLRSRAMTLCALCSVVSFGYWPSFFFLPLPRRRPRRLLITTSTATAPALPVAAATTSSAAVIVYLLLALTTRRKSHHPRIIHPHHSSVGCVSDGEGAGADANICTCE